MLSFIKSQKKTGYATQMLQFRNNVKNVIEFLSCIPLGCTKGVWQREGNSCDSVVTFQTCMYWFVFQVLQNVDELFDREELSAAPDAGWPDCFNSGVFVFRPSLETYQSLLDFAVSQGSFDGKKS